MLTVHPSEPGAAERIAREGAAGQHVAPAADHLGTSVVVVEHPDQRAGHDVGTVR